MGGKRDGRKDRQIGESVGGGEVKGKELPHG